MPAAGENFFSGHMLTVYGPDAAETGSCAFTATLPNGQSQDSALIATPAAVAAFGVAADCTLAPGDHLSPAAGAACWDVVDCVAWGPITNAVHAAVAGRHAGARDHRRLLAHPFDRRRLLDRARGQRRHRQQRHRLRTRPAIPHEQRLAARRDSMRAGSRRRWRPRRQQATQHEDQEGPEGQDHEEQGEDHLQAPPSRARTSSASSTRATSSPATRPSRPRSTRASTSSRSSRSTPPATRTPPRRRSKFKRV